MAFKQALQIFWALKTILGLVFGVKQFLQNFTFIDYCLTKTLFFFRYSFTDFKLSFVK